jgi:two-component system response regulator HydG
LLLANTFLARHARRHGIEKIAFSKNCEKAIISHHWPGNVRELENAVERAVILADDGKKIEADLLGIADFRTQLGLKSKVLSNNEESNGESMEDVERKHIKKVLESCDGNRTHAAKKLGLNVRTLRNKIKEYDLES